MGFMDKVKGYFGKAKDVADDVGDKAKDLAGDVKEKVEDLVDRDGDESDAAPAAGGPAAATEPGDAAESGEEE